MITAIAAMVISVCALVVSVYELRVMRIEQRAETWPYVMIDNRFNNKGFELYVQNLGTGPALLHSGYFFLNEKRFERIDEVFDSVLPKNYGLTYSVVNTSTVKHQVLPPEESKTVLGFPWTDESREFIEQYNTSLDYVVCYCSVLEKCIVVSRKERKRVNKCSNYDFGFE